MTRLMADCADTHPRLAATFYTTGFGEMAKRVAAFLKTLAKRRDLSINDPDPKAEQLIAAWLGISERRQSLGVAGPPSADAIAKRVRYATDTMIRARSTGAEATSAGESRFKRV
jgi:TetR/AcrR family transcriptional regulator, mexJK operon transcriptional repressor